MRKRFLLPAALFLMGCLLLSAGTGDSYAWQKQRVGTQVLYTLGSLEIEIAYDSDCGETGESRFVLENRSTVPICVELHATLAYRKNGRDLIRDVSGITASPIEFEGSPQVLDENTVRLMPGENLEGRCKMEGLEPPDEGESFHALWHAEAWPAADVEVAE